MLGVLRLVCRERMDGGQREPVGTYRPIVLDHASYNLVPFLWLQEALPVPRDQSERVQDSVAMIKALLAEDENDEMSVRSSARAAPKGFGPG